MVSKMRIRERIGSLWILLITLMAASTAGQIVLRNAQGQSRSETFTMTPANDEYATFGSNGKTSISIMQGGEAVVDIQVNNDGVTTCTQVLFKSNGQDVRNRYLMAAFAVDSAVPTRLVTPIKFNGGSDLQLQFKT